MYPDTWTAHIRAESQQEAELIAQNIIPGDPGTFQDEEHKPLEVTVERTEPSHNILWTVE